MNLGEEVDLEDYVGRPDKINNAEIMSICQEAGMQAVRKNRCAVVCHPSCTLTLSSLLSSPFVNLADSKQARLQLMIWRDPVAWLQYSNVPPCCCAGT